MKKLSILSAVTASVLFIGCGGVNINISDYPNKIRQKNNVPDICKSEYEALRNVPRVAVVKFTNNSSFGKANTTNKNSNSASAVAVGVSENGIGAVGASSSHSNSTSRVVDPKLDKAIASALEGSLAKMGGADIYSRSNLNQVMKEQKLQQTGLFDEKTLVKVGKLAGVRYIVTGSIDGVTQKFEDYREVGKQAGKAVSNQKKDLGGALLGAALSFGGSAMSGMKVTTNATIKIIDVETGKIVFSEPIKETKNIGMLPHPTYSQVIGGIKDDLIEGIKDLKPQLSQYFAPSGYIVQVRSNNDHKNFIAQINLGSQDKIKPSQTFKVYKFDEETDPVTNKVSCDKYTMNVKLTASKNQIQAHRTWTVAEGDDAPKLRAGQIIKRDALKNSLLSF